MQNYWDQSGYSSGNLPANNDALINQMLQRTRDITIFLTSAHKSNLPAGSDQWLIGQRRDWVKQNGDFEFVASPAVAAAAKKSPSRFILLAERAKASSTGDRVLLYSDGTVAPLSEADAQAAPDAQANQTAQ
jgi:hypothetical protein